MEGKVRKGYYLNGLYTNSITRRPSSVELATDNGQVLDGGCSASECRKRPQANGAQVDDGGKNDGEQNAPADMAFSRT